MMKTDDPLKQAQADHLLLLVGSNPLPNAVAGQLLVADGGKITLIYSGETTTPAGRLLSWLKERTESRNVAVELADAQVEEANPASIRQVVINQLVDAKSAKDGAMQSVGLHYTGGTKAMSVHAYRAVEQWAKKQNLKPIFSYLDSRRLCMVIDEIQRPSYVGRAVSFTIRDLIKLHGWTFKQSINETAIWPMTAQSLACACSSDKGLKAWRDWKNKELAKCCKAIKNNKGEETRHFNRNWENGVDLGRVTLTLPKGNPSLTNVCKRLDGELGLTGQGLNIRDAALAVRFTEAKEVCEWLDGKWLEHYVLSQIESLQVSPATPESALHIHERGHSVRTNEVDFEVDVIAMRGYQLFAFTCSTDSDKNQAGGRSNLKKRLFEGYVRARQLGGDEACVALVCCAAHPEELEKEMRRDMDAGGRIRVFGRAALPNLKAEIETWIRAECGEFRDQED